MKKIILIVLIISSSKIYSQTNSTVERSFSQHLIQENILILEKDNNIIHDPDLISIKLDTIGSYYIDIIFLKFKVGNRINKVNDKLNISFNSSSCNEFILAYNVWNYKSYRLKGFNGNDLLFLIRDINKLSYRDYKTSKLLRELNELNLGLNFKDLYRALSKFDFDAECLKQCTDPVNIN
ncbi:hypothetical protein [Flavobacterium subsaxonicum]|uniref:Uncharacterized protein n=1 Tax=Flavobacterium subsaxonicum WB 4.1-42 = DSM 21790 TaxID=1121898 RepID=A0A0A2MIX0_9FLAO|nr:hypothetical protein [Flavobacterium subsaxonicum]KGO92219.1 hypothetical protein Q766_13745 [Flavobacterium subsaxonicum WB 4.1-42 = DSM 21790]